jgi:hypothetical protein
MHKICAQLFVQVPPISQLIFLILTPVLILYLYTLIYLYNQLLHRITHAKLATRNTNTVKTYRYAPYHCFYEIKYLVLLDDTTLTCVRKNVLLVVLDGSVKL